MAEVKAKVPRSIWFMPIDPYRRVIISLGVFVLVAGLTVYYLPIYREYREKDLRARLHDRGIGVVISERQERWGAGVKPYVPEWVDRLFASFQERELSVRISNGRVDRAILRELLGLGRLKGLTVQDTLSFDDEALSAFQGARALETLYLYKTGVTGKGMRYLEPIPSLKILIVEETPFFDDEALSALQGSGALKILRLRQTSVTAKGLRKLGPMPSLKHLAVEETRTFDDEALSVFKGAGALEYLVLRQTGVTAKGFRDLQPITSLKELVIGDMPYFDDDALGILREARALERLSLSKTGVTARGLRHLKAMPSLRDLTLPGVEVTAEDLRFLDTLPLSPAYGVVPVGTSRLFQLVDLRVERRPAEEAKHQEGELRIRGTIRSELPLGPGCVVSVSTERDHVERRSFTDSITGETSLRDFQEHRLDVPELHAKGGGLYEFRTEAFGWDQPPGPERVEVTLTFPGPRWGYLSSFPARQVEMPGKQ